MKSRKQDDTPLMRAWRALLDTEPEGPTDERRAGIQRAMRAASLLIDHVHVLADPTAPEADVKQSLEHATSSYCGRRSREYVAKMDLIHGIFATAHEIRRARVEPGWRDGDVPDWLQRSVTRWLCDFEYDWPEYGVRIDRELFWTAAEKWLEVHDDVGRDRWKPVCDVIESAGLGPCRSDSIARQWKREMHGTRDPGSHG
jgi:hypothetical protein